ncbi:hypothetical protein [Nocardia lijiangensis]|uniref:hypothetical protein n=1 Tax=Nocardia lijiangensis TaxID=299618 RepID=UPI000A56C94F|nr:hypothetical protein [Nocardia lijiangensis]
MHDLPIAVAGPATAVAQIRTALDQRLPGGFDITEVTETAAAEQLIRDRQVYGAIDVSSGTLRVIVASAASTVVAQTLQAIATDLSQADAAGSPVAVRDLAALPADSADYGARGQTDRAASTLIVKPQTAAAEHETAAAPDRCGGRCARMALLRPEPQDTFDPPLRLDDPV